MEPKEEVKSTVLREVLRLLGLATCADPKAVEHTSVHVSLTVFSSAGAGLVLSTFDIQGDENIKTINTILTHMENTRRAIKTLDERTDVKITVSVDSSIEL